MNEFLGSVMMAGLTMGSLLGGAVADRFGRKRAMAVGMSIAVPSVLLGASAGNYYLYVLLRLTACTTIVFSWIGTHNFFLEYFSKSHRKTAYCVNNLLGHLNGYALPILMYFYRDW